MAAERARVEAMLEAHGGADEQVRSPSPPISPQSPPSTPPISPQSPPSTSPISPPISPLEQARRLPDAEEAVLLSRLRKVYPSRGQAPPKVGPTPPISHRSPTDLPRSPHRSPTELPSRPRRWPSSTSPSVSTAPSASASSASTARARPPHSRSSPATISPPTAARGSAAITSCTTGSECASAWATARR